MKLFRDGHCLEGVAAHGHENEVGLCDQRGLALTSYFKVEPDRSVADAADIDAYFQQIIQLRRAAKVAFQMRARQPHVQLVEHHAVGEADGAKQFRLGKLEEAY